VKDTLADTFRTLDEEDFGVLSAIERGMVHNEWVPSDELPSLAGLHGEETQYRVSRLNDLELIETRSSRYVGYRLVSSGYDVLALNALVEGGTLESLGAKIEVGKESDVYECAGRKRELVIKMHREGYTEFRDMTRERDYTHEKGHLSWMYTARKAAESEYKVLKDLYPDVSVPEPIEQNRHTLAMERFDGIELRRGDIDEPGVVLDAVVRELSDAWDLGYVHADMSGYNVLVAPDSVCIIDWPQSVETDHPHARKLLDRDISNLLSHLRREYPEKEFMTQDEVLDCILS